MSRWWVMGLYRPLRGEDSEDAERRGGEGAEAPVSDAVDLSLWLDWLEVERQAGYQRIREMERILVLYGRLAAKNTLAKRVR